MSLRNTLLTLAIIVAPALSSAESLDINLSDDAFRAGYSTAYTAPVFGDSRLELGLAFNDDEDWLMNAGLGVFSGPEIDQSLQWNLGLRTYGGSFSGNRDMLALSLGGKVRFSPANEARIGLSLEAYYAPKIISFLDSEGFLETEFRAGYRLAPNAEVYLGWRRIKADFDTSKGDLTFDKGSFIGVKFGL